MFACCCNQGPPAFSTGVAVTMSVRTQSGGVPFAGMATPDGYYPEGDFFLQREPVLTACIARCVELANQLPFQSAIDQANPWDVYKLVHPAPIYAAPGLRISVNDVQVLQAVFNQKQPSPPGGFPNANWGPSDLTPFKSGAHWSQDTLFTQRIVALKCRIAFATPIGICVGLFRQCGLSLPYADYQNEPATVHLIPSYEFSIAGERSASPCGSLLTYWKWTQAKIGTC